MIEAVYLGNFKSYKEATIDLTGGMNAIIGENGAGKSTILEAIGFCLFDHAPMKMAEMMMKRSTR